MAILKLGVVHERKLSRISKKHWQVFDRLHKMKAAKNEYSIRLHWLLLDFPFENINENLIFEFPFGNLKINFSILENDAAIYPLIFRAGKLISDGETEEPLLGWYSPTYGIKEPAISVVYPLHKKLPVEMTTDFRIG